MDSQQVEIIGRNTLITSLTRGGWETAEATRDRGIDLIAFLDRPQFTAVPLQLKAASTATISIDRKYEQFPELKHIYVWGCGTTDSPERIFCLSWNQLLHFADQAGWTTSNSWLQKGKYATTRPTQRMTEKLACFEVTEHHWHPLLAH